MRRPNPGEYSPGFARYVDLVPEEDIVSAMERQSSEMQKVLSGIDDVRAAHRYADEKWTVREVIGHIIDTERILSYRGLCIARGEQQPLPGFDENDYNRHAGYESWKIGDVAEEYALVRRSNIVLYKNLSAEAWERIGSAAGHPLSVLATAFVIVGHERHHLRVLKERYGV